jgi:hypothetical protein
MTRLLACVALILSTAMLLVGNEHALADTGGCDTTIGLGQAVSSCTLNAAETHALIDSDTEHHVWRIHLACEIGGEATCNQSATCGDAVPPNSLYEVLRDDVLVDYACLSDAEADTFGVLTPGRVERAFKALAWPAATLTMQPPGGRTLVNLETNFYTTTTQPDTQTVTLLGQRVEIEATPTAYAWQFGDGTTSDTTDPGHAYPDMTVTHTYESTADGLAPSVDVTYAGRYRVEGGDWADIADTLTVAGPTQALTVLQAIPHLTGSN